MLETYLQNIKPLDQTAMQQAQAQWNRIAKPLHSLGRLEDMVIQLAGITGSATLAPRKKAVLIFCADNGIIAENVTQSDNDVTAIVTENFTRGITSVNALSRVCGADVYPVDVGVARDLYCSGLDVRKVAYGTRNFAKEPAMTREETVQAICTGIQLVKEKKEAGYNLIATGEMGIGNTTTSSAVAAALLSCDPKEITGKGAGLSDTALLRKIAVVEEGIQMHELYQADAFDVLCAVGGLDIAGLSGVFIGGALAHVPVVIDGVISAVAALAAERMIPGVRDYVIPSHKSREPAAERILEELGVRPVLDAGLALGEGTGAVMMCGLLDIARTLYGERTTFADIDVAPYHRFG